jgi:hypothetical protein
MERIHPGDLLLFRRIVLSFLLLSSVRLPADEGMWTFDRLPLAEMKTRYGFAPDQAWLDHLRLSTVIFGDQGTGAFVGRDGLVLTNHHVAHPFLQKLSVAGRDYVQQGFVAAGRDQEIPVPGLELRVLIEMKNVTTQAKRAMRPGTPREQVDATLEALRRREAALSGLECEHVELYGGGEHWIYGYRKFRDVRLVMAPEYDIAAFGKDWDNFAYPRHDLDFSLFRVYENGRPHRPAHTLAWSRKGIPNEGMTLVAGHPGRTNRFEPLAQVDFRRRVVNPLTVRTLERTLGVLQAFAARGGENARLVSAELLDAANFLKLYREETRGLEDPELMQRLRAREKELQARIQRDPHWRAQAGGSWNVVEHLLSQLEPLAWEHQLLHRDFASLERGPLRRALRLVRLITEAAKPVHQRDENYASDRIRSELLEPFTMDRELEIMLLAAGLEETRAWLGDNHSLTRDLLRGGGPREAAEQALRNTRLDDPAFVRALIESGKRGLEQCDDPLVLLAGRLDPHSRETASRYEALESEIREHEARIAQARYAFQGETAYPEATFTLRLSYGAVRTYLAEGTLQPPFTTFGGLFDRADAWGPLAEQGSWALPPRWVQRRKAIDPSVPLDFITTNDIIGGNSGSPVVDRDGELVGVAFDGNLQSIPGRFHYDERRNRCIALDARAILESLAKVYDAPHLVKELTER